MTYEWIVSDPKFESDLINPKLKGAYWEGHRDFAYDFLRFIKPAKLVELGSQYGCSLFCFCQAVKDFNLETEISAVDFWKGDIGAADDGETVFSMVNQIKDTFFSKVPLKLYQMNFDAAVSNFQDGSIDIIHIDGGHRFEDVDHDFKLWLPKLKENGILLFHDVFSHIDQGSCEHWKYICEQYNAHFDFSHSCGLGILFPKGDFWYKALQETDFFRCYKDIYYYRSRFKYVEFRYEELCHLYEERYEAIENQSRMIDERDQTIAAQTKLINERYEAIKEQGRMIDERDETIKEQANIIQERSSLIEDQAIIIKEKESNIRKNETRIMQLENMIESLENSLIILNERIKNQTEQYKIVSDFVNSKWDIKYRWNKQNNKRKKL